MKAERDELKQQTMNETDKAVKESREADQVFPHSGDNINFLQPNNMTSV